MADHTLTTRELRAAAGALAELAQRELPVKASYAVGKNLRVFQEEASDADEERRKIVERHAEKDEDGKVVTKEQENGFQEPVFPDEEAEEKAQEEWNAVLDEEVEVKVHEVPLSYFGDVSLPPRLLAAVDFMIED